MPPSGVHRNASEVPASVSLVPTTTPVWLMPLVEWQ
jgi:hypothetical protein